MVVILGSTPGKDASGIPETQNVRNSGEDLHPGWGSGFKVQHLFKLVVSTPKKILSTPKVWGEKKKYVKPPPVI